MKNAIVLLVFSFLIVFLWGCSKEASKEVDLSPLSWPEGELAKYTEINSVFGGPKKLGEGDRGIVCGTTYPLAVRAGLEALKKGGSAADAAMVTSLAQCALHAGAAVSFAGIMTMVYFEASSGKTYSMNAAWKTCQEENDPLTIPSRETPSGRSALVPGFMAGVQAAHERFGKLPFNALFEPTIYFAETGIEVGPGLAGSIERDKEILTRLAETRKVFTKENGDLYKESDIFKQPQLAYTMKRVAKDGIDYLYKGEWAKKMIDLVQQEGGKMTLKDLEEYDVIWSEPFQTTYKGYEVFSLGLPSVGGLNTVETLNLLEIADLQKHGHYTESAEALYWFIQISRASYYFNEFLMNNLPVSRESLKEFFPDADLSLESRLTKETANRVWDRLQEEGGWGALNQEVIEAQKKPEHSAAVIAVDDEGNVAAVLHSINTMGWGGTGIFVDGISIPDSACIQQELVNTTGPGVHMPEPTNPLIVLKDGKPVYASSAIGMGLHEVTIQNLVNILDYGMDPQKAAYTAKFGVPSLSFVNNEIIPQSHKQGVVEGDFSDAILEAVRKMGQEIQVEKQFGLVQGFWVGVTIDPNTGKMQGGVSKYHNGHTVGY
jgi:gamma-glutamyltranspeptidase/glutathione hydrolase